MKTKQSKRKGAGEYNTVKTDTITESSEDRAFLRALSAVVMLTPAEEKRILPDIVSPDGRYLDPDRDFDERLSDVDEDFDDDGNRMITVPKGPTRRDMKDEEAYLNSLAEVIDESDADLVKHFLKG